jgi:hypothetical protein
MPSTGKREAFHKETYQEGLKIFEKQQNLKICRPIVPRIHSENHVPQRSQRGAKEMRRRGEN